MTPDEKVLVEVQAKVTVRRDTHRAIMRKLPDVIWYSAFYFWVLWGAVGSVRYPLAAAGGLILLVVATTAMVMGEVARIGWATLVEGLTQIMKESNERDQRGY